MCGTVRYRPANRQLLCVKWWLVPNMGRVSVIVLTYMSALLFALALPVCDALAQQSRQRLERVGEIGFGTDFEDARSSSDALVGLSYSTGDRRVLKTLAQTKVALFGTSFNLTYLFGTGERLTRVFGSVANVLDLDKKTCLTRGAHLFAESVRQYGSPDIDRSGQDEREWRFNFGDGRWIRLRYYFGGVLGRCGIVIDSVTPEGQNDRT
jgi:hypothetical protein